MNLELLYDLLGANSPSGYESAATEIYSHFCAKEGLTHEFTDSIGNVAYSTGNGNIPFMLSGHIDQIGLQVQYIDKDGFVYFIKDGGVDPKVIPGSIVTILRGDKFPVYGVIGKTPIHIEARDDAKNKVTKLKDLKIDIGASSKEEAEKMVSIGDPIVFQCTIVPMLGKRIASGSIDDKVGVYVTAMAMSRLSGHSLKNLKVFGVACTQEEVGGHGASLAAKRINPQYSIDYDVTFATDDGCVSKKEWGDIKLGGGGCIAYGPDKNKEMCDGMKRICEDNNIKYQVFSVGAGATNTLKIKLAADDCKTLLLSIPERNMHTSVEVCSADDLESLVDMTVQFILDLDSKL